MQIQNIKVEKKENSMVEISGEIEYALVAGFREPVLSELKETIEVDGFRKGHVPENIIEKHVGEDAILEKMAQKALGVAYPAVITQEKIDAIGQPQIMITKLAKDNPLGFKIITAVVPELALPDYKAIAKKAMSEKVDNTVSDEEFASALEQFQRMLQSQNAAANPEKKEGEKTDSEQEKKDEPLPELTDEFTKKMGDFKDVADFKAKLRESLVKEKEMQGLEKQRLAMAEELIKDARVEIPDVLVQSEQNKMLGQFKDRLAQSGMELKVYLDQIKKTEEEIIAEMKPESARRVTLNLALAEIAKKENISPDKERVEKEVEHILSHHKDANPMHVRLYVEDVLTNEAVFKFLEEQK